MRDDPGRSVNDAATDLAGCSCVTVHASCRRRAGWETSAGLWWVPYRYRAARDVIGPTTQATSEGWALMAAVDHSGPRRFQPFSWNMFARSLRVPAVPASSPSPAHRGARATIASPRVLAKQVGGGPVGRLVGANSSPEAAFSSRNRGVHLISGRNLRGPSAASGPGARTMSDLPQYWFMSCLRGMTVISRSVNENRA